jgi:chemotaxis protein methyltransferase CheR
MSIDVVTRVAALVERESGIVLGPAQLGSLQAAIARVAPGMTADRLLSPQTTAETLERLIDEITVRETFFFRHRTELDAIDWHGALRAARSRGADAVRVWIAGCASGEEAYTIAILACEAFGSTAPPVRILATDIAPSALAQARRGRYGARAVRTLDDDVRRRYFSSENGTLSVSDRLRELVEVRRHNLVLDKIPPLGSPPFDLILCRNVLIYFDRERVDRVVASLQDALWPGGRLLLGAADRLSGQRRQRTVPRPSGMPDRRRLAKPSHPPKPGRPPSSAFPASPPPSSLSPGAASEAEARAERISRALQAANRGDLDTALTIARDALADDPLDAEAHFITGVAELARNAPQAAVDSLRRALYSDPSSSLAAFQLARAHDALGERGPARRAYEQALRTLDLDTVERSVEQKRDLADITAACRSRLRALVAEH